MRGEEGAFLHADPFFELLRQSRVIKLGLNSTRVPAVFCRRVFGGCGCERKNVFRHIGCTIHFREMLSVKSGLVYL